MGRFVIEFGLGVDFHGQDVSKAAAKAVRDAVSRSCLCGLVEVLKLKDLDQEVEILARVGVSKPELVDVTVVAAELPIGKVKVEAVQGGLTAPGIYLSRFGDQDESVEVAVAAVEVRIAGQEMIRR